MTVAAEWLSLCRLPRPILIHSCELKILYKLSEILTLFCSFQLRSTLCFALSPPTGDQATLLVVINQLPIKQKAVRYKYEVVVVVIVVVVMYE